MAKFSFKKTKTKLDCATLVDSKQLLVLTINTWIPYLYDVPVILGYPNSFKQRFRYKDYWLSDEIKSDENLVGKRGLIILRDSLNNLNIPLRFFEVVDCNVYNDIYFIDVKLLDIVDFGNSKENRNVRYKKFDEEIKKTTSGLKDLKGNQKPFAYYLSEDSINTVWETRSFSFNDETNWRFINEKLINESQYKDSNFFKIISKSPTRFKNKSRITTPKNVISCVKNSRGLFIFKSGFSYYLDLLQIIEQTESTKNLIKETLQNNWGEVPLEKKKELSTSIPYEITLSSSSEAISIAIPKQIAVGEYDRLRFMIGVRDIDKTHDVFLEIKAFRPGDGVYNQSLILPVIIKPRTRMRIITAFWFFLSVLFAQLDDIVPHIAFITGSDFASTTTGVVIQRLGLISVAVIIGLLTYKTDITKFK